MLLSDFDYELPEALIAQTAIEPRDQSRLLVFTRQNSEITHHRFVDLTQFLRPGDCLIVNNSKVLPARLKAQFSNGASLEILLLSSISPLNWTCMVKPGRKIKGETRVTFPEAIIATITRVASHFQILFALEERDFLPWLHRVGELPLPPYIDRKADATDQKRYQTVYAKNLGSIAAPTAGLHFTASLLERLQEQGVGLGEVTLHVGYGTFAPIREARIENHKMHEERFEIPSKVEALIENTKANGGRVIAVGTTSLRALESSAIHGFSGSTDIFIAPGYQFKTVDGLITNFHLPKTSLLVLVAAMLGLETTKKCYAEAIRERYRFFSYGDAMAIL